MAQDAGIKEYVSTLNQVWDRLGFVGNTITKEWNSGRKIPLQSIENGSIQLRLACEGVLFASYALHSDFLEGLTSALRKGDKWDSIRKKLEGKNVDYMPKPCSVEIDSKGVRHILELDELFVTGREVFQLWGNLSEVLHHRNPLKPPIEWHSRSEDVIKASLRLGRALASHTISIPDAGTIYYIQAVEPDESNPSIFRWRRLMKID